MKKLIYILCLCCALLSSAQTLFAAGISDYTPDVVASATTCDAEIIFTLQNYNSNYNYQWSLDGTVVAPDVSNTFYKVATPVEGTTYSMVVTADSAAMEHSHPSVSVDQKYIVAPNKPAVTSYSACPTPGTKTWSSMVTPNGGNTLNWYDTETSNPALAAEPTAFDTDNGGFSKSYWVSQTSGDGCESVRAEVKVEIYTTPDAPGVTSYSACPTPGTKTWSSMVTPDGSNSLKWYDTETSNPALAAEPTAFDTDNAGFVKSYWVSQVGGNSCESVRAEVKAEVKETPAAPTVTQYSECQTTGTKLFSDLITATGTLRFYDSQNGGNQINPTPVDFDKNVVVNTTYWVSQTKSGCESDRAELKIEVKAKPAKLITHDYSECQQPGTQSWNTLVENPSGNTLKWYAEDGTELPNTMLDFDKSTVKNKTQYVTQIVGDCESEKAKVVVNVIRVVPAPGVNPYDECQVSGTKTWSSLVTKENPTNSLKWYADNNPTTVAITGEPVPFNINIVQTKSYWVSQESATECESERVEVSINIKEKPVAPVPTDYIACQTTGVQSWESLATFIVGADIKWYETETSINQIPTPDDFDKNVVLDKTYWVSQQMANGCESDRVSITVKISAKPVAFAGDDRTICAGEKTQLGTAPETGFSYTWTPASMVENPNISNPDTRILSGTTEFTLTVTNLNDATCKSTDKVTVTVRPKPNITLNKTNQAVCPSGVATFTNTTVEPNVMYEWSPADKLVNPIGESVTTKPLTANQEFTIGAYYIDMPTCFSTATATVSVVENPTADAGLDQMTCDGGTTKVGVPGVFGVNYTWEPASALTNPNIANPTTNPVTSDLLLTLTATLAAEPFCSSTDNVRITKVSFPNQYNVTGNNTYCLGGSTADMIVKLSDSDVDCEYSLYKNGVLVEPWRNGTGMAMEWDDNTSGVYTIKARVVGTECEADMLGEAVIYEKPMPTASLSFEGTVACPGQTVNVKIQFTGEAPYEFTLSNNGVQRVLTSDNDIFEFDITVNEYTELIVEKITDVYCTEDYFITAKPHLILDVDNINDYKIRSSETRPAICPGDAVELKIDYNGNTSQLLWSTGETTKKITVMPSATSIYSIRVITESGCILYDSIQIQVGSQDSLYIDGLRDPANYCSTEPATKLIGFPDGGTFSSEPTELMQGDMFTPNNATASDMGLITYTYADALGCIQEVTDTVYVSIVPEIDWSIPPEFGPPYRESYMYCQKDPNAPITYFPLQGWPKQQNGEWVLQKDPGNPAEIQVIDQLNSTAKLVNAAPGVYHVTYRIVDVLGCQGSKTKKVEIINEISDIIPEIPLYVSPNDTLCILSDTASIYAERAGGRFTLSQPSLVVDQDLVRGRVYINPSLAPGVGRYNAIYSIGDSKGCVHDFAQSFEIVSSANIHPFGLKEHYCTYDPADTIHISSTIPTTGIVYIYKDGVLVNSGQAYNAPPMFRPNWGAGHYEIVYSFNDGICKSDYSETVEVYAPPVIDMNLKENYCKGEEIALASTPDGGNYFTDAPNNALVGNEFLTERSGLGEWKIKYEVANEWGCKAADSTKIKVNGADELKIFDLDSLYCEPNGIASITGFPSDGGEVTFTGPAFLTNTAPGKAELDLSQANYNASYTVKYHYTEVYFNDGVQETCTSTLAKDFKILNEASDFGGFHHLEHICGDRDSVRIAANHTENTRFIFSDPASPAFKDYGNGTAVIYPPLLGEGLFSVKMEHDYIENGVVVCDTEKEKSFYILRISDISDISLYCDNAAGDNTAVQLDNTEAGVRYELLVNDIYFQDIESTGGNVKFSGIDLDYALVKIKAYQEGCNISMSKTIEIHKLKSVIEKKNISCNGLADGWFSSNVVGGGYPYNHRLDHNAGAFSIADSTSSILIAGDYTYSVTDTIGCTRTNTFTIGDPDLLEVTIDKTTVRCAGDSTGTLRALPVGGTMPYSYKWTNLDSGDEVGTTATLTNMPSGNYRLELTDANGCTAVDEENIDTPDPLTVSLASKTDVVVTGQATGTIDITVMGGTAPYSFVWTGNSITTANKFNQNLTDLLAGNYYVVVTDDQGCKTDLMVTITEPAILSVVETIKNVSCNAYNDGFIHLNISGGVEPYIQTTWTLPDGVTTIEARDIDNMGAGIYHFYLEDSNGNIYQNNYRITEPQPLVVSRIISSNLAVMCYGDSTANIDVEIRGGTLPYNVTWQGINSTQLVDSAHTINLGVGTYLTEIKDANNCATSISSIVTQPDKALTFLADTIVQNKCFDEYEGAISIGVEGGTPDYTYAWSGEGVVVDDRIQTGLKAGAYSVRVTDDNACFIEKSFTLDNPAKLNVEIFSQNVNCNGGNNGSAWPVVSGGSGAYTFVWKDAADVVLVNDSLLQNVVAGLYKITITDALGCEQTHSVNITEPTAVSATVTSTAITCFGENNGTANIIPSGGVTPYTYKWVSLPSNTEISTNASIDHLAAGGYRATVTDANGCAFTSDIILIQEPTKLVMTYTKQDVAIFNEATGIILTDAAQGTAPYTYTWLSGPSITPANMHDKEIFDLLAGNYYLLIEDANGCAIDTTITITQPELLNVVANVENIKCNGDLSGLISLTVSGGTGNYFYNWTSDRGYTSSNRDISGLEPAFYTVIVSDDAGATFTNTYQITQPDAVVIETVDALSKLTVDCFGDKTAAIKVDINGGVEPYLLDWSGVDLPPLLTDSSYVTDLGVGTYQIRITDANSCVNDTYVQTITGPDAPITVTEVITENTCFEQNQGSIVLTVSGGTAPYTYLWTGGPGLIPTDKDQLTLHSGQTYQVAIKDANNCTISKVYTMAARSEISIAITEQDVSCAGQTDGKLTAAVTGGEEPYIPEWSNLSRTFVFTGYDIDNVIADTYIFTVQDAFGCIKADAIIIEEPTPLSVSIQATEAICYGVDDGQATAVIPDGSGTRPYTYTWYKDGVEIATGARITNLGAAVYRVVVEDANGCTAIDERIIRSSPRLQLVVTNKQDVTVYGEATGVIEVQVNGGTPPLEYLWTGVGIDPTKRNDQNQYDLIAGNYNLYVVDDYSCSLDTMITITQPEEIIVTSSIERIKCFGDKASIELTVSGGSQPYTYSWVADNGFTSSDANIYDLEPGTYSLTITDAVGKTYRNQYVIRAVDKVEWNILQSSKTQLNCFDDKDGNINIEITGGTQPYSIHWYGPNVDIQDVFNISDLDVGTYSGYITDVNGCIPDNVLSQAITQPDKVELTGVVTHNICADSHDGTITIDVTGGIPGYTYSWSGFDVVPTDKDQVNLKAGNYRVAILDQNLCELDSTFIVQEQPKLTASLSGTQTNICAGDSLTLHFNVSGTAPFEIVYTDGISLFTINTDSLEFTRSVSPSTDVEYSLVSLTDANNCDATLTGVVPVSIHPLPQITILSSTDDMCLGGSAEVDIIMANAGPWTIRYTDGTTVYEDGPFDTAHDTLRVNPTTVGTIQYTIQSISNQFCTAEVDHSFDVEVFPYPNLDIVIDPAVCEPNPFNINLEAVGVGPWQVVYYENGVRLIEDMDTPSKIVERFPAAQDNTYFFESIRSGQACVTMLGKEFNVSMGKLPAPAVTITGDNQVCRNSEFRYVTPPVQFATSYKWNLPTGYEIISGMGSNEVIIKVNENAQSGRIYVSGLNDCGQGDSISMDISVDTPMGTGGRISAPVFVCENERMFQLSVSEITGANEYEWTVPAGFEILSGQYTRSILVAINEYALSSNVSVVPRNYCAEGDSISRFISIRPLPLAEAGVDFNTNCSESASLNAVAVANAVTKWTLLSGRGDLADETLNNTQVENLLFGENTFRWDVNDGYCISFDTVKIINDNPGITQPEVLETTICEDHITLRAPQPTFGSYRWKLIAGDGQVQSPDSIATEVTGLGFRTPNFIRWEVYHANCSNIIDVQVISNSLSAIADAGQDGISVDGSFRLSARMLNNSDIVGEWTVSGGAGTIENPNSENTKVTGLAPGINTLRWTLNAYGCEAFSEVQVRYVDGPFAGFETGDIEGCAPLTVYFSNTTLGDAQYEWDFGDGAQSTDRSPEHVFETPGIYRVTLKAIGVQSMSIADTTIRILEPPTTLFEVHPERVYLPNALASFYNYTTDAVSYYWEFGDGVGTSIEENPVYEYRETGLYDVMLVATGENTCSDTLVIENAVSVGNASFIVFPTAFTPNVEAANGGAYSEGEKRFDIFYPVSRNVETYKLEIFNQWGIKVFMTEDLFIGWDGYYQNQCAAQASYVYKVEGKFRDGTSFRKSGNILLIR